MAFEVAKTGYQQIAPTFLPGYPYEEKYHNVGQLQTPYEGKKFGTGGDYGPPQRTRYYTVQNPNYPYVLDSQFRAEEYLPTEGCCYSHPGYFPCYESKYPERFVPPNYFAPQLQHPTGHALPIPEYGTRMYPGKVMAFEPSKDSKEYYDQNGTFDYRRLRVAHKPLKDSKRFYPFGHGRYY